MTEKASKTRVRLIVLILWILLAAFYFSLAYDYIIASNKDKELDTYLQYIVEVCGDDHRPNKEVRMLILNRADELMINLRGDQVGVSGSGQSLKINVSYMVDINMPVLRQSIYRKVFQHETAYRNFR
jgi:hypothetical protein